MLDYELKEFGKGSVAYSYKKTPHHWICKDCADNKNLKMHLKPIVGDWSGKRYSCSECGAVLEKS